MEAFSAELVLLCVVFVCVAMGIPLRACVEVLLASCSRDWFSEDGGQTMTTTSPPLFKWPWLWRLAPVINDIFPLFCPLPTTIGRMSAFHHIFIASWLHLNKAVQETSSKNCENFSARYLCRGPAEIFLNFCRLKKICRTSCLQSLTECRALHLQKTDIIQFVVIYF